MPRILIHLGKPLFYCPGCQTLHQLDTRWRYNYNPDFPTFKEEIRLTAGPFPPGHPLAGRTVRCVSVVRSGRIHFLKGTTHDLAGHSLMLPDPQVEMAKRIAAQEEAEKGRDPMECDPVIEPKVKAT